jgi:hypothetical protein
MFHGYMVWPIFSHFRSFFIRFRLRWKKRVLSKYVLISKCNGKFREKSEFWDKCPVSMQVPDFDTRPWFRVTATPANYPKGSDITYRHKTLDSVRTTETDSVPPPSCPRYSQNAQQQRTKSDHGQLSNSQAVSVHLLILTPLTFTEFPSCWDISTHIALDFFYKSCCPDE